MRNKVQHPNSLENFGGVENFFPKFSFSRVDSKEIISPNEISRIYIVIAGVVIVLSSILYIPRV